MTQHSTLTAERWAGFSLDQQILMIANEMNRAGKLNAPGDRERLLGCYERVLRLVDLTVQTRERRSLRRELLRWRDLIGALYIADEPSRDDHLAAFRCLLQLNPTASRQIEFLL
jgi:hypothetical protein